MSIRSFVTNQIGKRLFPRTVEYFESQVNRQRNRADYLEESLTTIGLELENLTYQRLNQSHFNDYRYSRRHVNNIIELAVHMGLKNPITARSINVQADYVFGQGVKFVAHHPWVQEVVDEFVNYEENKKVLTNHTSMLRQERRQQIYGSMFFALYTNKKTGRVIVRTINSLEVDNIIRDPDDYEKELYVKHISAVRGGKTQVFYHPVKGVDRDSGYPLPWEVDPTEESEQGDVMWDAPVIHIAANRLGKEKFAMPEVYPQLDWAIAYKRFLEDWTSIIRAFARMALKITGLAGKKQAAAAKSLVNTSISLTNPLEKNPSPAGGSMGLFGKGVDVEAVKTAGATTGADEGDAVLNMAGCGVGLPNTFFGDAGKGNFATAKTLDRPTELKMLSRQKLWKEIFTAIFEHVIFWAACAPEGILAGYGATAKYDIDVFTGQAIMVITLPKNKDGSYGVVGQPISAQVDIQFPEILERDVADRVRSLVNAFTLFGKPLTDIIPDKRMVARLLLQALNVEFNEQTIASFLDMWKQNMSVEPGDKPAAPYIIPPPPPAKGGGAEDPSQGGAVGTNG